MNDKQFMGLRVRFEGGEYMNSARQSICGVQTRWWRMHESHSIHGAPDKFLGWRIDEQC